MLLELYKQETYTQECLPALKKKQRKESKLATEYEKTNYELKNPHENSSFSLKKLIGLVQHGLHICDYSHGLVLVNDKYIVSLASNKWRVKGKQTWYDHKHDLTHFVCNYILKEPFKNPPTPEQELDYFEQKLKEVFTKKPQWLIAEIRKVMHDESLDV